MFVGQMVTPASTLLANPCFDSTTKRSAYARHPLVVLLTHALEAILQTNSSANVYYRHSSQRSKMALHVSFFSYNKLGEVRS